MAHVWFEYPNHPSEWVAARMGGCGVVLAARAKAPVVPLRLSGDTGCGGTVGPRLLPVEAESPARQRWVLLTGREVSVSVNGLPITSGIRDLRDKDELRVGGGQPMYFSTEHLPTVEVFAGAAHSIRCARCQQEIAVGADAVRCPSCGIWHHQSKDRPCWTGYAQEGRPFATCALCDQRVALGTDAEFRWTPEGL